jgi:hypothetical protein
MKFRSTGSQNEIVNDYCGKAEAEGLGVDDNGSRDGGVCSTGSVDCGASSDAGFVIVSGGMRGGIPLAFTIAQCHS